VDHDVIVVGGGPAGAALAHAARGLSSVLVAHERREPRADDPALFDARVYALSPGNMAFLRQAARLPVDRLTPVHAMQVFGDAGARIEFDAYRAGVPALAWIVEDAVLQDALWTGLPGEAVIGRCESMVVERDRVVLRIDGARELTARLIVGADGASSFVRESAGIRAAERTYGQVAVVANFACERPHRNTAFQWFQGGPVLALLPLPGNRVSMVWSLPAAEGERIAALAPEVLSQEVEAACAGQLGALASIAAARSYPLRRLAAKRLVVPRVALVGDAAHVIHPLAGQGLNLGLQDVRELAAVLERSGHRDPGDHGVLRRYERARAEPILAMDATVDGLFRLFGARANGAARLRNAGLNLTDRLGVLKNLLIRQAMN
jgi:ubiquinone biosynthesis UbiH/UbiF/VisC/COQ6 family hydroxylase